MNKRLIVLLFFLLGLLGCVSGEGKIESGFFYIKKTVVEGKSNYSVFNEENKISFILDESGEFIDCRGDGFTILYQSGALMSFDLKSGRKNEIGKLNYASSHEINGKFYFDDFNNIIYAVVNDEYNSVPGVFNFSLNKYDLHGGVSSIYSGVGKVFAVDRFSENVIRLYQEFGYIDIDIGVDQAKVVKKYGDDEVDFQNLILIKSTVAFFNTNFGGLKIRESEGWGLLANVDEGRGFYIPMDYDSVSKKALVVNVVDDGDVLFEIDIDNGLLKKKTKADGLVVGACYADR